MVPDSEEKAIPDSWVETLVAESSGKNLCGSYGNKAKNENDLNFPELNVSIYNTV